MTHAILHLIYSRFWTKVMRDLGMISNNEPAANLFTQGMVLKGGTAMSKSKGNVVDPDEMVAKYGADTCRLFTLFAAPPERDREWDEKSIEGVFRFVSRVYRFVTRNADAPSEGEPNEAGRKALRKLHQTLDKITRDFDNRWHFNTSIAALMELMNELTAQEAAMPGAVRRDVSEKLCLMMAPFAPFAAQEMWSEELGRSGPVFRVPWPTYDPDLAREDGAEVPVQVNGKLRSKVIVPFDTSKEDLERIALADAKVRPWVEGKAISKVVVVPGKLVNIVVKG